MNELLNVYTLMAKGNKYRTCNAYVKEYRTRKVLYSFEQPVCCISKGNVELFATELSQTTARHIKYFLEQNGLGHLLNIKRHYTLTINS